MNTEKTNNIFMMFLMLLVAGVTIFMALATDNNNYLVLSAISLLSGLFFTVTHDKPIKRY